MLLKNDWMPVSSCAIVGAGITGVLWAHMLCNKGVRFQWIEKESLERLYRRSAHDGRLISVSPRNMHAFQPYIDFSDSYQVFAVRFYLQNECVHVHKHSVDDGPIAYMVPYTTLYQSCLQRIQERGVLPHCAPYMFCHNDGRIYGRDQYDMEHHWDVILACDGRKSTLRSLANIEVHTTPIYQKALVGRVESDCETLQTAFECFLTQGVLTLLPEEKGRFSFIWHINEAYSKEVEDLSHQDFIRLMNRYVPDARVRTLIAPYQCYRVNPTCAKQFHKQNVYLCGETAHNLHPLSGQSMNVLMEALRAWEQYCSPYDDYVRWSAVYERAAYSIFRSTSWIDMLLSSKRFLSLKKCLFQIGRLTHATSFFADYILGGPSSLDRLHMYQALQG